MEKLEREPTENELAQALGMEAPELALYQTQAQPRQLLSLDEIIAKSRGDENLSLNDRLPDPAVVPPDAALLLTENRRLVRECLKSLPKTQVTVIVLHYLQGVSLREVANTLAVTPSRVSQLHHQALGRLLLAWQRYQKFAGP